MNERIDEILNSKQIKCNVSRPNKDMNYFDLLYMESIVGEVSAITGEYDKSIGGYSCLAQIGLLPECEIEHLQEKGYIVKRL